MPPLIAAAVASSLSAAIGSTAATIVGGIVSFGAMMGLQMLLSGQPKQKTNGVQNTIKQALPNRQRFYGWGKMGGALFFMEVAGGELYQGVVHCEGPIDAIEEWWLNDKLSTTSLSVGEGGNTRFGLNGVGPWNNYIILESHLGATGQPRSQLIMDRFAGTWTDDHRLAALAYTVMQCRLPPKPAENFQKHFPNGAPSIRILARGVRVYDPRLGQDWNNRATWAWSENPAICILDFLTHERGFNIPKSRMNVASFVAMANLCDELVPTRDFGDRPRYVLGQGTYELVEEPKTVLTRMLATCDGEIVPFPDGTVGIRGGRWDEPTVTIPDEAVLSYEYQQGDDRLAAFNRLKITFTDPAGDWQQVEAEPWDDVSDQALQGVLVQDLPLPMVTSSPQARRLAKVAMAKGNPRHRLTILTTMAGLDALGERTVRLRIEELGLDVTFLVTKFEISDDISTCTIGLDALDASAYDWDPYLEDGNAPQNSRSTSIVPEPPAPQSVAVVPVEVVISATNSVVRARATCDPPDGDFAEYFDLIGRVRRIGDADWFPMGSDGDNAAISDLLSNGEIYEVQVAFEGFGKQGGWTNSYMITI